MGGVQGIVRLCERAYWVSTGNTWWEAWCHPTSVWLRTPHPRRLRTGGTTNLLNCGPGKTRIVIGSGCRVKRETAAYGSMCLFSRVFWLVLFDLRATLISNERP